MNVLLWHVHGSWTTALVQGNHRFIFPVDAERGPDGRGRAQTWTWPSNAVERSREELAAETIDAVILQRPHEIDLVRTWLGKEPGRDVAAVYVEHNVPQGRIAEMRHPAAELDNVPVAHVTHFNELFWDCGSAPTLVVEHGIVDPGYRYTGERDRCAVVINEARRRGRVTGTDLLARFAGRLPVELFGMDAGALGGVENLRQSDLHAELPRRRVYLHPVRWTSLGLSLIEAMHLGMPVVALATTEVPAAVPPQAGIVSTNVDELVESAQALLRDRARCVAMGREARAHALRRYGLQRFLRDWDQVLERVCA